MLLHILWHGWGKTLCGIDNPYAWRFYDVKNQYDIYLQEKRIEEFNKQYCSACLKSFRRLILASKEEIRRERNIEWEKDLNKSHGNVEVSLSMFEEERIEIIPIMYSRYRWIKSMQKQHNIEEITELHPLTIEFYREASFSYINGQFLSSILSIGVTIDQFIRQLVDPNYNHKKNIPNSIFKDAVKLGFITKALKKDIQHFKDTIRNHTAHPKTRNTLTLGFEYIEDGENNPYWGTKDKKPIYVGPIPGAKKGFELFWRLVKHAYRSRFAIIEKERTMQK